MTSSVLWEASSTEENSADVSVDGSDDDQSVSSSEGVVAAVTSGCAGNHVEGTWVRPGEGLLRTKRNNRLRRQKKRTSEQVEQEQLFLDAVERSQKRQRGEHMDEDVVFQMWLGRASERHEKRTEAQRATIKPKDTVTYKRNKIEQVYVLPPTQRPTPVPKGVRLTRVDCDDCYTPWPWKDAHEEISPGEGAYTTGYVDTTDDAYAVFQSKARLSLQMLRQADELDDEEIIEESTDLGNEDEKAALRLGLPLSFGKRVGWDGMGTHSHSSDLASERRDKEDAVVVEDDLDYGDPSTPDMESMPTTLRRLRSLRASALS